MAAVFELPSKKRGWGGVTTDLHTPVSPLFRGELYKIEIELLTGKKNQLWVHFSEKGHPLVGDDKYGKKGEPKSRLALNSHMGYALDGTQYY